MFLDFTDDYLDRDQRVKLADVELTINWTLMLHLCTLLSTFVGMTR